MRSAFLSGISPIFVLHISMRVMSSWGTDSPAFKNKLRIPTRDYEIPPTDAGKDRDPVTHPYERLLNDSTF